MAESAGRICRALYDYIERDPDFEVGFVLVRGAVEDLPPEIQTTDPAVLRERPVDLVVEEVTPEAVADLGEAALEASDLMLLSGSALVGVEVGVGRGGVGGGRWGETSPPGASRGRFPHRPQPAGP